MICSLQYAATPTTAQLNQDLRIIITGGLTVVNGRPTNLTASSTTSEVYGATYTNANALYTHDASAPGYFTKVHHLYNTDTNWFRYHATNANQVGITVGDDYTDISTKATTQFNMVINSGNPLARTYVIVTDKLVMICVGASFLGFADVQKNGTNVLYPDNSTCAKIGSNLANSAMPSTFDFETDLVVSPVANNLYLHALNAPPTKLDGYVLKFVLSPVSVGLRKHGFWQVPGLKAVNNNFLDGGIVFDADQNPYWTSSGFLYNGSISASSTIVPGETNRNARLIIQG